MTEALLNDSSGDRVVPRNFGHGDWTVMLPSGNYGSRVVNEVAESLEEDSSLLDVDPRVLGRIAGLAGAIAARELSEELRFPGTEITTLRKGSDGKIVDSSRYVVTSVLPDGTYSVGDKTVVVVGGLTRAIVNSGSLDLPSPTGEFVGDIPVKEQRKGFGARFLNWLGKNKRYGESND